MPTKIHSELTLDLTDEQAYALWRTLGQRVESRAVERSIAESARGTRSALSEKKPLTGSAFDRLGRALLQLVRQSTEPTALEKVAVRDIADAFDLVTREHVDAVNEIERLKELLKNREKHDQTAQYENAHEETIPEAGNPEKTRKRLQQLAFISHLHGSPEAVLKCVEDLNRELAPMFAKAMEDERLRKKEQDIPF